MVPIPTTLRGSISNRLLYHYHGKPSFQFLQHNVCLNLERILNSSTLVSATHSHSPIETSNDSNRSSEIVPLRENEDALRPNYQTFQWLLYGYLCSGSGSLTDAQRLHGLVLKSGFILEQELCTSLIVVYVSAGCVFDVDKVFDDLLLNGLSLAVSTWNKIIACYAGKKLMTRAFCLLSHMVSEDCCPGEFTFANVLKACGRSEAKRIILGCVEQIHAKIIRYGFDDSHLACNPLIDLYVKNGLIGSAEIVFERLCSRDSATWVAMISRLSQNRCEKHSILLFCEEMHEQGIIPTPYMVSSILSACSKIKLFELGKELHALTFKWGLSCEIFVCNALVSMHYRWGDYASAECLFRRMQFKDGVSHNSLISGLAHRGYSERSFKMFNEMQRDRFKPYCVYSSIHSQLSYDIFQGEYFSLIVG